MNQRELAKETAVMAAFMMEGVMDTAGLYKDMLEAAPHDQGAVEKVSELMTMAPAFAQVVSAAVERQWDFCGVFPYEVATTYGYWYAQYCVNRNTPPPLAARSVEARWLIMDFFRNASDFKDIVAVLLKEVFPTIPELLGI